MAFEIPLFNPAGFVANAAMTGKQFTAVKLNGTNQEIVSCSVAGEESIGVIQDTPLAGEEANIMMAGITKLKAGTGGLAIDARWMTDANGDGVTATATNLALGKVLTAAAVGEYATVTVGLHRVQL